MTAQFVQLQGIGKVAAKEVGALVVGDVTLWNYGARQIVYAIEPCGAKSVLITWQDAKGKVYPARRYLKTRLIAVA